MRKGSAALVPLLVLERSSKLPLYRQLYEGCRAAIAERRLRPGERLPSTRSLAAELGVSRLPVLNAFEQLVAEGYCETRTGAGTFVAGSLPQERSRAGRSSAAGLAVERPPGRRVVARGTASSLRPVPPWLSGSGAFSLGETAIDHFPMLAWSRLISRLAKSTDPKLLRYGATLGFLPLREAIAGYLGASRAVRCSAEQIMVVSGSQQALELAARVLLDRDSPVWFEEPGYWGARDALRLAGARLVPVPVDREGLDVAAGIARSPKARAVFVTPSHQLPLGVTMSASRRLQLLAWAQHSGAWVIEDDYNSEYRYESQPVAALQGLDRDARVLYIGTFSKVLYPSLRVGYLVLPPDLVQRFVGARRATDICPATLLQAALAEFIDQGHFARHLHRTRQLYRERRRILVDELARELGDEVEVLGDRAGLHLTALLRHRGDDRAVAARAARDGLWTLPLSDCYLGAARRRGLVLGYGGIAAAQIPAAVRALRRALESS